VVAASVTRECIDAQVLWCMSGFATAQHCGQAYGAKYLGAHQMMEIDLIYDEPDPKAYVPNSPLSVSSRRVGATVPRTADAPLGSTFSS